MKRFFVVFVHLCFIAGITVSCDKNKGSEKVSDSDSIYYYVDDIMKDIYLWNDKMPTVNWHDYSDPDQLMSDMLYLPVDRWSHVYKKSDLDQFLTGESVSYGFQPAWDGDIFTVLMVYKNTDAYRKGLRRGMQIVRMNGTQPMQIRDFDFFSSPSVGESLSLEIKTSEGSKTITVTAGDVVADQIMYNNIYSVGSKKAGYVVYENFTEATKDSLITVMENFRQQGVNELIIDLRYNGGGDVAVLIDWMSKIMPARYNGKPFFVMKHNSKNAKYDKTEKVAPDASSLGIERVFVISSKYTASASEALINGLKPYMQVHQIGETTHGKPVGMYVIPVQDWYVVPISFEYTNAVGAGGFYNGIQPEQFAFDDLSYDWGNVNDPALAQALHYIEFGSYSSTVLASRIKSSRPEVLPQRSIGLYIKKQFPSSKQ